MRRKEVNELREWKERSKKQSGGERPAPKLPMSILTQSRASCSNRKAAGIDGISLEIFSTLPWREGQKTNIGFELRYKGQHKEDIETWLRNTIVLIPKRKWIDRLEGQSRGICVQSVLPKWYCGCITILMEIEMRNIGRNDEEWVSVHTLRRSGETNWGYDCLLPASEAGL